MIDTPNSLKPAFRIKKKTKQLDSQKLQNPNQIKEQLMREMLQLDKQRAELEQKNESFDFGLMQSYKDMIQTRRLMLDQINKAIN